MQRPYIVGVVGVFCAGKTKYRDVATSLIGGDTKSLALVDEVKPGFTNLFYADPRRWGLSSLLQELSRRLMMMEYYLDPLNCLDVPRERKIVFMDGIVREIPLLAEIMKKHGYLTAEEYKIYEFVSSRLMAQHTSPNRYMHGTEWEPDIIVHLHVSAKTAQRRVLERVRTTELSLEFFKDLLDEYSLMLESSFEAPILTLPWDDVDTRTGRGRYQPSPASTGPVALSDPRDVPVSHMLPSELNEWVKTTLKRLGSLAWDC